MRNITSFYPVLATSDVEASSRYFESLFGFEPGYVSDWYVHLNHPASDAVALALVSKDHETVPEVGRVPAAGLLINFEVESADAEYETLRERGAEVVLPLRDEAFGQRHFIVRGPEGVLIDVIQPIPPTAEYASAYVGQSA
ncbi:MAG: VOC family protein [Sandaracinaceae bacterium]|nr:MAG: glyoxalase [Sandaracinaceae bacterium]